jgi:uncharacterized protein
MPDYQFDHNNHVLVAAKPKWPRLLLLFLLLSASAAALSWYLGATWQNWLAPRYDSTPALAWAQLQTLDYENGTIPAELQAYAGQRVKIPGFIVLLDAEEERLTEFLLVPVYGMCIHIPPPPPNLMIHVRDAGGIQAQEWMIDGVWLKGILHIESVDSEYGAAGFRISEAVLEPLGEVSAAPEGRGLLNFDTNEEREPLL